MMTDDEIQIPYTVATQKVDYEFRGQQYSLDLPVRGLLVACVCNGFGNGTQTNHIVVSTRPYKTGLNKGKPRECLLTCVKSIDPDTGIATCEPPRFHHLRALITQECWHCDASAQIDYYRFGAYVVKDTVGYMK